MDDLNDKTMEREPLENIFDDFVQEIEAELSDLDLKEDALKVESDAAGDGYQQMLGTFLAIMQQALKPVTRYVKAIKLGETRREMYEIIWLTIAPLLDKVQQVGLIAECGKLEDFVDATEKVIHAKQVLPRMRFQFFMTFAVLVDTFKLDCRGNRQAVNNLITFYQMVCQDEKVNEDDLRLFFAMGIPSLTWVRKTPTQEIQSLSGMTFIGIQRMKQIVRHFRHEREMYAAERWQDEQARASAQEEKPLYVTV
jgi:hypothetical protein